MLSLLLVFLAQSAFSQREETNYDEAKVPLFQLPDPLRTFDGKTIGTVREWEELRRPELLDFFTDQVYGRVPDDLGISSYEMLEEGRSDLVRGALRQQVKVTVSRDGHQLDFVLLLYLPESNPKAPVFLGPNFYGNHGVTTDQKVLISDAWAMNSADYSIEGNRFTEASRGSRADRWAIQQLIDAGFGLATFYYGEIDPDKNDFTDGIHPFFYQPGQTQPTDGEWGSIAAWAWGMSRALDYLVQNERVDASQVIAFGHSRLGKTALWAGANDRRFAAVIANNSGCGGAALSKRKYGETLQVINTAFPHWFTEGFKQFNGNEEELPVDQHELIALIAPRPVYVASAQADRWADPKGEYLGAYHAGPAYDLYGKSTLPSDQLPAIHEPIFQTVGYHIREGVHYVTEYDWEQYIRWASEVVVGAKK